MYGLQTINHINARNAEAEALIQRHAASDAQHTQVEDSGAAGVGGEAAHRAETAARLAKANETRERILNGARG